MLHGSSGLQSYIDDVLAHTSNWDEHLKVLRDFFERVRAANMSLKPSKCEIGFQKIEFLGTQILEDSIAPNAKNLSKILDFSRPANKTQIKSFLGLTGFYQQFIPHYSELTTPLTELLKRHQPDRVRWGCSQENSFVKLKDLLVKGPILKLPLLDKPFMVRTDASGVAVGAVLFQYHDGIPHPVSYASKKFSDRERLYPISQKEALSCVFGIQRF
jgi:hypothetical protein